MLLNIFGQNYGYQKQNLLFEVLIYMEKEIVQGGNALLKLFTILGLILLGALLASILTLVTLLISEGSLTGAMSTIKDTSFLENAGVTRFVLFLQHFGMFLLPAFLFGAIFYKRHMAIGFDLERAAKWQTILAGSLFILAALPLVNLSFMLNETIELPAWASIFEAQANDTLESILRMDNFGVFLINFLLIGLLPAIGEELIFRGIVQKYLSKLLKSPIVGIWLSAIIFSAIHFQFEGFFPRMVLGAVLGYLYYWTSNLWVPIFAHLVNNGLQVVVMYFSDIDLSSAESNTSAVTWYMILGSVAILYTLHYFIKKNTPADVRLA